MRVDLNMNIVRLFCNYLVLFLHATGIFAYCHGADMEQRLVRLLISICDIAMPTLFFISGVLFFSGFTMRQYCGKIKKRISTLVVPYCLWNIIACVLAIGFFAMGGATSRADFQSGVWGWFYSKVFSLMSLPGDSPMWYIRAIFIYALISPVFYLVNMFSKIVSGILILITALFLGEMEHGFPYAYPAYSFLCFFLGLWFTRSKITALYLMRSLRIMLLIVSGVAIVLRVFGNISVPVIRIAEPFFLLTIVPSLPSKFKRGFSRSILADAAFFVYGCHIFFMTRMFVPIIGSINLFQSAVINLLLSFFATAIFCLFLYRLLYMIVPCGLSLIDGSLGRKCAK